MTRLPDYYPHAQLPIETLLDWAHLAEPPIEKVREAVPWLKKDGEVRAYLEGVLHGRLVLWRTGSLSGGGQ